MRGRKKGTNQNEYTKYLIPSRPLALTQKGEAYGEEKK